MDIEEFEPTPINNPKSYPGKRPKTSYLFMPGSTITKINMIPNKAIEKSIVYNDTLDSHLNSDLIDRYMIVGYGSNANPAQLRKKFSAQNRIFPVLKGKIKDYDVVYANNFTKYGSIPATIVSSPGTVVEVWVNLLDKKQLSLMDKTEGRRNEIYILAKLEGEIILENHECISPIYSYVHSSGPIISDNSPIRLRSISVNNAKFIGKTQEEILECLRQKLNPQCKTIDDFIKQIKNFETRKKLLDKLNKCSSKYLNSFEQLQYDEYPLKISQMVRNINDE